MKIVISLPDDLYRLAEAAARNFRFPAASARISGLPRDSVIHVSQVLTLDREYLTERAGMLSAQLQHALDAGLRLVLDL
jgi:mRNA-degrading endonuclease toxin of MazEF toxin-antitoxin module